MCHKKWGSDLETSVEYWHGIYSMSCILLKIQNYKTFTLNYCTYSSLAIHTYINVDLARQNYAWKLQQNMLHLFWNCNIVRNVWFAVQNVLQICVITLSLNATKITLGISKKYIENRNTVNYSWLFLKYIKLM